MAKLDNEKGQLPYNMVLTNDWMLIVLRQGGNFEDMRINSLNYLGIFLAQNIEEKKTIVEVQPLDILQQLAVPIFNKDQKN